MRKQLKIVHKKVEFKKLKMWDKIIGYKGSYGYRGIGVVISIKKTWLHNHNFIKVRWIKDNNFDGGTDEVYEHECENSLLDIIYFK